MSELTRFESALEARLRSHAAAMRPSTDASGIARQAVQASRRTGPIRWSFNARWLLLAGILVVAAAAAVVVVGALRDGRPLRAGSIVFTTADGLWLADAAGSDRRLVFAGENLVDPRVSPDGQYVLLGRFDPWDPNDAELLVIDLAGHLVGRWDRAVERPAEWVPSQAGPLILYDGDLGSSELATPAGDAVFRLSPTVDGSTWTPEGSLPTGVPWLLFRGAPSRVGHYVAGQAMASTVIVRRMDQGLGRYQLAPDGSSVAYVMYDLRCAPAARPCNGELWINATDGSSSRRIARGVALDSHVVWDRSGGSIVVTGLDDQGRAEALRVHLDGRVDAVPLPDDVQADSVRFALTADPGELIAIGRRDAVRDVFTLWRLDLTTGSRSALVTSAFGVDRWEPALPER